MKRQCIVMLTLALVLVAPSAAGAREDGTSGFNTFSLYWENDALASAGTDQDYSNGLKLTWTSSWLPSAQDRKLEGMAGAVEAFFNWIPLFSSPGFDRAFSLSFGQMIYTPSDLRRSDVIITDRPYAGYIYAGLTLHRKDARLMDTIEVDFGAVGPVSMAEQTQKTVHRWIGDTMPEGWDNQLYNEPTFEFTFERKWKLRHSGPGDGFGWDFIPHLGGRFGNVYIYGNTGAEIRFGYNSPGDFGTCLIRPGCNGNALDEGAQASSGRPFGAHVYFQADGRVVLRDIFLDGNTFEDSHSVEKKHFVADLTAGLGLTWGRLIVTYGFVYRTKEYVTQGGNGQTFGTLLFSCFF